MLFLLTDSWFLNSKYQISLVVLFDIKSHIDYRLHFFPLISIIGCPMYLDIPAFFKFQIDYRKNHYRRYIDIGISINITKLVAKYEDFRLEISHSAELVLNPHVIFFFKSLHYLHLLYTWLYTWCGQLKLSLFFSIWWSDDLFWSKFLLCHFFL